MSLGFRSPFLRGLTRLTLYNLEPPSAEEFHELCVQNPHLEYLELGDVMPTNNQYRQVALNSLRTLELVVERRNGVRTLFRMLSAPALQELSFRSQRQHIWQCFEDVLESTGDSLFEDLRILQFIISKLNNSIPTDDSVDFPRA